MSDDPLSDVLRSVRLRGAAYWYVSCRDDWAAASPQARAFGDVVLPEVEHVLAYHLIAKGNCWATMDGEPPVRLRGGDIVMFPRGDAHLLSSAPGLRVAADPDGERARMDALRNTPKPVPISFRGGVLELGAELPAEEASTIAVCGFIGCDLRPFNPLIDALPRLLHLPARGVGDWVPPVLHQAAAESRLRRPGSSAVLDRVSEMLFVDAARRYLQSLPEGAPGWLGALRDRHVGKAIGLLHERLAEPWTIEALGRQVGLSRSALHDRFMHLVGQAPMQYLTNWRMQAGARLLREGRATVATIAQEVGYESEAAFSRAFKRLVGLPPAAWRRRQRLSG